MIERFVPMIRRPEARCVPTGSELPVDALFNSMVERFFGEPVFGAPAHESGMVMPSMDVKDSEESVVVTAELPGVNPEEVDISLEEGRLTIKGEKKSEHTEEKDGKVVRMERSYGSFSRTVLLPSGVDEENITAGYRDGVLTVTVPKVEEKKPRRIEITDD